MNTLKKTTCFLANKKLHRRDNNNNIMRSEQKWLSPHFKKWGKTPISTLDFTKTSITPTIRPDISKTCILYDFHCVSDQNEHFFLPSSGSIWVFLGFWIFWTQKVEKSLLNHSKNPTTHTRRDFFAKTRRVVPKRVLNMRRWKKKIWS